MKKFFTRALSLLMICTAFINSEYHISVVKASDSEDATEIIVDEFIPEDLDLPSGINSDDICIDAETIEFMECDYVKDSRKVHEYVKENGLYTMDSEGHLLVSDILDIFPEDADDYLSAVDSWNEIVDLGIGSFNEDLSLDFVSADEIVDKVYEADQQCDNNSGKYRRTNKAAPNRPTLRAYDISKSNKEFLRNNIKKVAVVNPSGALTSTIALWVAKVRSGGEWDYKSVAGYKPYNKEWNAILKNNSIVKKTTELFGNYNYGFTGMLFFNESILLAGGDAVSWVHNGSVDSPEDKRAISQGCKETS